MAGVIYRSKNLCFRPMGKLKRKESYYLSSDDWEKAALKTIAKSGVKAVAVEPLARTLCVSKGSFYWHFENKGALLEAALKRWEREESEEFIAALQSVVDPRERLKLLIQRVSDGIWNCSLHCALSSAASNEIGRPILERVTQRRIEYVKKCYLDMGLSEQAASHRASLAYTIYVGYIHLNREAPGNLPGGNVTKSYLFHVLKTMIPPLAEDSKKRLTQSVI